MLSVVKDFHDVAMGQLNKLVDQETDGDLIAFVTVDGRNTAIEELWHKCSKNSNSLEVYDVTAHPDLIGKNGFWSPEFDHKCNCEKGRKVTQLGVGSSNLYEIFASVNTTVIDFNAAANNVRRRNLNVINYEESKDADNQEQGTNLRRYTIL